MFCKLFLFGILATTFVQCHVPQARYQVVEEYAVLTGPLDDLKEQVNKGVEKAKQELKNLKDDIENEAKKVVDETTERINNENEGFLQQLKALKERAEKLAIDITDCVKEREQELRDLPANFGKQVYKCGTDKVDEGKALYDTAKIQIEGAVENVKSLSNEYDGCGDKSFWAKATCYGELAGKITAAAINIPLTITSTVTNAINLASTIHIDLEKCALEKARQASAEGQQLLNDITACVKAKVDPE